MEDKGTKTTTRRKRDKAGEARHISLLGAVQARAKADQYEADGVEFGSVPAGALSPVKELLKVKIELLEGKLELLTNRFDAHEKKFKNNVIEVLDEHVTQRFKEEQEETSTDTELSDKAEIKLHGIYHSEDTGVRIELDWNNQFISYLRSKGIPGVDDEQVVKHWLASMLREIENSIDGKRKVDNSEFT